MFLRWAHIHANTTGAVIGLTKEKKLQCTLSERSWLVLATSHSLSRGTRKQVCGIGLCIGGALRPIGAGFQNANSGRLAGSSHQDCEQVVWRVEAGEQRQAKAGQGQVELCGWASALSAYLAGEASTDRIEESSGEQWRVMDCGPLSTLVPKNP